MSDKEKKKMDDPRLVLADQPATDLVTARKLERAQRIAANDYERKRARSLAAGKVTDANAAAASKATAVANADGYKAQYDALVAAQLSAAALTDVVETDLDPAQGHLVYRTAPAEKLTGKPPVERKRIKVSDADCDAYAVSYAAGCAASDEATDLVRQIERYKATHPELFVGPGEPPPVDPTYEALKASLAAKVAAATTEMSKQAQLIGKYLASETITYSWRYDIATGEFVLGDRDPADEGGAQVAEVG